MKKISLLFILFLTVFHSFSQTKVTWEPDVYKALEKAKASGKLLFVEAYLPTCPACQAVEPNFSNAEVAAKYNENFVNFKMDVSKNDGPRKFLDERGIRLPSFPQFLFFDGEGNLAHQGEVSPTVASINGVADDAKTPENRSSNYKKRFENGERSINFLVKYGVYTRLMTDTLNNHLVADALYEVFPKEEIGTEMSWAVTKKVVACIDNGFFKYWIDNIPKAAELEKKAGHGGQEMNTLGGIVQSSLFSKESRSYNTEKVNLMRGYMKKIGAGEYADAYLWEYESLAKIREGKKEEALEIGKRTSQKFAQNGASQIFIAKVFTDNYPDKSYVPVALEWLKLAKPLLKENNHLAEYHFELARLNQKQDNAAEAKKNATEAVRLAKLAKSDTKKFEVLLKEL
jgi:thiol-disulfide isomerase/thioredoxin